MPEDSDHMEFNGGDSEIFPETADFSFDPEPAGHPEYPQFPIAVNPVIHAALRALYTGGPKSRWLVGDDGRPCFRYESVNSRIEFFFSPPPDSPLRGNPWDPVKQLSVETADVFLVLVSRIARLPEPRKDIARISLDEISRSRGVRVRHGGNRSPFSDLQEQVMRLGDLRIRMSWQDRARGGTIVYGARRPDSLLDIIDIQYKSDGESEVAFKYRCGQALAYFLSAQGLRWIESYSRYLLRLSPFHDAFTKKLGTYWILSGTEYGRKGAQPWATPLAILEFCGEDINWRNPGQTLDSFIDSHRRLEEIGILEEAAIPEPPSRIKGYFRNWLETAFTVRLSDQIWKIGPPGKKKAVSLRNRRAKGKQLPQPVLPLNIPEYPEEIVGNPELIRKFRTDYLLKQSELAEQLGISCQSLSNYERGLRALPAGVAVSILDIWKKRALLEPR